MVTLRHASRSFAFKKPGEPFEVPDEDADKLISRYGCEVVGANPWMPKPSAPKTSPETKPLLEPVTAEVPVIPEETSPDMIPPVETSPGWWLYEGKKYRRKNLPPAAAALLE